MSSTQVCVLKEGLAFPLLPVFTDESVFLTLKQLHNLVCLQSPKTARALCNP